MSPLCDVVTKIANVLVGFINKSLVPSLVMSAIFFPLNPYYLLIKVRFKSSDANMHLFNGICFPKSLLTIFFLFFVFCLFVFWVFLHISSSQDSFGPNFGNVS